MQILKIFLVFIGIFVANHAAAQIKFFNIYTNNGYDFGEGITQLADSSYLVTGSSSSFGYGPSQAFIMKVDSAGNHLWAKSYGGAESDWGRRIFAVENDGIYVAGFTNSSGNGSFDISFFKTDMNGELLFERTYGGSKFEKLHGAVMMPDTTFILVGETSSNATEVEDIYMLRLKANGDTIWTKKFGSAGKDIARNINIINDTTFVVVGDYYVADSLKQKAFVTKMNIDGTTYWTRTPGGNGIFSLNDVTFNNNIIRAVGYNKVTNSNNEELSHWYRYIAEENGDLILELVDTDVLNGRLDYLTSYGSSGKFYAAEQALITTTPVFGVGEDCLIQRVNYYLYWDNSYVNVSNIGQDQASQMIRTSDGGAMVVGYNTYYGGGGKNIMLIKIGPNDDYPVSYSAPVQNTLVYTEEIKADFKLSVYPNPVQTTLKVESTLSGMKDAILLDLYGKKISQIAFDSAAEIDFQLLPTGVYLLKIISSGNDQVIKIVKK